jgi:hypothetical protein
MQDGISKIKTLLKTGKVVNVNLAYELAKGLGIDADAIVLEEYQDLFWLANCNQDEVKDRLVALFSMKSLIYTYDRYSF